MKFTKEQLLQKGVSPEMADEILASYEDDTQDDDSLLALEKALNGGGEPLSKAKGEKKTDKEPDDNEDDKEYDENYMKKYMIRYMKENKSACRQSMKDAGVFADEMKKAVEDLDLESGAVVEMNDLGPFISKIVEFNGEMLKAMELVTGQVDAISTKAEATYDLMQKAAQAQVDSSKLIKSFMDEPTGRKGKIADTQSMQKAVDVEGKFTPAENNAAYQVLMKAVTSDDINEKTKRAAGEVISAFEAGWHDMNRLRPNQKKFVRDLMAKEAN